MNEDFGADDLGLRIDGYLRCAAHSSGTSCEELRADALGRYLLTWDAFDRLWERQEAKLHSAAEAVACAKAWLDAHFGPKDTAFGRMAALLKTVPRLSGIVASTSSPGCPGGVG